MAGRAVRHPIKADLDSAVCVVRAHLPRSPLLPSPALGAGVWLKVETMQPSGAFKVRGALAALSAVTAEGTTRIVTASAGNHALGVAWAAERLGISATVVVAATASPAKLNALATLPIELVLHGESYDEAEAHGLALSREGAVYVSPYNDPLVIAGQATIGHEVVSQIREGGVPASGPLTIVAGIGGGGLVAGLALWAAQDRLRRPEGAIRIVGIEAERSRAMTAAVNAGGTVTVEVGATLADGLAGNLEPDSVTVPIIRDHEVALIAVSEAEIEDAMRWLAREHGLVVEGAGAAGVAALLGGKLAIDDGGQTVVVLTGRNIALDRYAEVLG
nr:pyridoxal-phosphate dependent enzyme [Chloroflexia bacterium]